MRRPRQGARTQGFFTIERSWPSAAARGHDPPSLQDLPRRGHVQKERTLTVDVPPGVEEGTRIRLPGEGEAGGNGGPPGDL